MIKLNDYLYEGDTVPHLLYRYCEELRKNAENSIDKSHSNFLLGYLGLLEQNEFLVSQSERIIKIYEFLIKKYSFLAINISGRIKSLMRLEIKYNAYICECIYKYYEKQNEFPDETYIKDYLKKKFRDQIGYKFVISIPRCKLRENEEQESVEIRFLYEIANLLPGLFEEQGFEPEFSNDDSLEKSGKLTNENIPYYRDYVYNPRNTGYRALHISLYDCASRCNLEVQLKTMTMNADAEIGEADHSNYEKGQAEARMERGKIKKGENLIFDQAYERMMPLQELDLSLIDVNMFYSINGKVCDGAGLIKPRLIAPHEHLSRFQN